MLVLGVAYKPDIGDMRESPALKMIELLQTRGRRRSRTTTRTYRSSATSACSSVELEPDAYDAVVIVTDHSGIDYGALVDHAGVVVDFRNATGDAGTRSDKVWKL